MLFRSPLIDADDLRRGVAVHEADAAGRPALAVARYPAPVEWAFDVGADGSLRPRDPAAQSVRSQDLRAAYYDTGTFMFFSTASVLEHRHGADGFLPVELPPWKAADIDEPDDLRFAERLYLAERHRT